MKHANIEDSVLAMRGLEGRMQAFKKADGTYDIDSLSDFYTSGQMTPREKQIFDWAFGPEVEYSLIDGSPILEFSNTNLVTKGADDGVGINFDLFAHYQDIELRGIEQMKHNVVLDAGTAIEGIGVLEITAQSKLRPILEQSPLSYIRNSLRRNPEIPAA